MSPRLIEDELKKYLPDVCVNLILEYAENTIEELLLKLHRLRNTGVSIRGHYDLHSDPRDLIFALAVNGAKLW